MPKPYPKEFRDDVVARSIVLDKPANLDNASVSERRTASLANITLTRQTGSAPTVFVFL